MQVFLKTVNLPNQESALFPCVYVSTSEYSATTNRVKTENGAILNVRASDMVGPGEIAVGMLERVGLQLTLDSIHPYTPYSGKMAPIDAMKISVEAIGSHTAPPVFDADTIATEFVARFETMVFRNGQKFAFKWNGVFYRLCVSGIETLDIINVSTRPSRPMQAGMLTEMSRILFEKSAASPVPFQMKGAHGGGGAAQIFNSKSFDFKDLDIGGLNEELTTIFRKVFTSRLLSPTVVEKLSISHVKGLILYGPPGTGKTLIARQLSKSLKAKSIKVVNGPELISAYVGRSEENVRALFKEAEEDMHAGTEGLHVIVFDEFDSLCRKRGESSGVSGDVNDKIVTQLLSKIDGVDALNNILLIGMTNRVELLDSAILRPGRFEVHVEISLPDEKGRKEILAIHTRALSENKCLTDDVSISDIAAQTKNYTGAELEGLVRDARSYAVNELVDLQNLNRQIGVSDIRVRREHFERAIQSYIPRFGATECDIAYYIPNGIMDYCEEFVAMKEQLLTKLAAFQTASAAQLYTVLLKGPTGSGKTAFSAWLAKNTGIPYMKIISNNDMIGFSEQAKTQHIRDVFEQAYISENSVIVLDNIETIVEWYRDDITGSLRFMSSLLNAIKTLIRKAPTKPRHKLIILLNYDGMQDLDKFVSDVFEMPAASNGLVVKQLVVDV